MVQLKRFISFFIFLFIINIVFGQPCPNNLNGGNNNNNNVTLYIYNINNEIIGTVICNQAGNGNMNCNLTSLPTEASYLSFGNINNHSDLGSCIYNTNGIMLNNSLPIELISFSVKNTIDGNSLEWVTASENNNDYFLIEISTDLENWNYVTKINGSGNSNSQITYEYLDNTYNKSINYYRLIQVDFNGTKKIYEPVVINNTRSVYIKRIINLLSEDVDINTKGILIIQYSDGSNIKIFNN